MIISITLCMLLSLLFTYVDYKQYYKKALILKSCATLSIAFLSYVCFNINSDGNRLYFILIFIGILCGLIGDFLLALDKLYIRKYKRYFISGLTSFLVGHIFYIKAFTLINPINIYDFIFAVICILIPYYVSKKTNLDFKELQIPIYLYTLVISLMLGKATSILLFSNNQPINVVIFIGTLLFVISDGFLSFDIFGEKKSNLLTVYCHLSYFPAQIMLALSVLFM